MNAIPENLTDREQYDYCVREMGRSLSALDFERHKYFWKELEKVKNRHGGMPPKEETK